MSLGNYYIHNEAKYKYLDFCPGPGVGRGETAKIFPPGMTSAKLSKKLQVIFLASNLFIYTHDFRLPCNFSTRCYVGTVLPFTTSLLEDGDFC